MPTNLEIKARIQSVQYAINIAETLPANFVNELNQTDTYFIAPKGRLKLREINGACYELIYYNRTETSNERLSDFEISTVADPINLKSILKMAYGISAVVQKKRLLYLYGTTRIHIDYIDNLGAFIEFEVPVGTDHQKTHNIMQFLISKFQIQDNSFIKESYMDLLLDKGT
jgi:predicted adenylyl cyclase CyaB